MRPEAGLRRELGTFDAVMTGLAAMVGAGVFAAFAPAADAAGSGLLLALGIAAVVAYCNAASSARLAARYPASGGTYVYGRERLGPFWGHLAGWGFVVGKTASCAAMALVVGAYAAPGHERVVAVAAVLVLTVVNCLGVRKTAWATRAIVAVVLLVLVAVCVATWSGGSPRAPWAADAAATEVTFGGVLQAAGLLFFAFAGYARIATLGEEVRDPQRTIPRAIPLALGIVLVVYAAVGAAALAALGPGALAEAGAPLADTVRAADAQWLVPVVRVGAALAALGSLLTLLVGVSRTTLAMARDRHLPGALAVVHARTATPYRAELAVGAVAALAAATVDLRGAIGFSSFGVLVYYAIAGASAWTLSPAEGRPPRLVPALGIVGCAALACTLPATSAVAGAAVLAAGALAYGVRARWARRGGTG
ncbi:APC family permease [Streptomyces sp. 796.1]|uniref:APC family permease n=1 Tax=Streptomyces sp. 796.1 TaxID=3163029 RepID=UPI0039C8E30C